MNAPAGSALQPGDPNAIANLDPTDDLLVAPPDAIVDCDARLTEVGVKFHATTLPVKRQAAGFDCGAPQVIVYDRGPTGVTWGHPIVTCRMAMGMARFETIAQEESERSLHKKIKRIENVGTYSCRKMAAHALVSEHSYANAIDVRGFTFDNGSRVSIESDFGARAGPKLAASAMFLRTTAARTFDENAFSVVLTPHFDALHRDHFHLDQARYRTDGTRAR